MGELTSQKRVLRTCLCLCCSRPQRLFPKRGLWDPRAEATDPWVESIGASEAEEQTAQRAAPAAGVAVLARLETLTGVERSMDLGLVMSSGVRVFLGRRKVRHPCGYVGKGKPQRDTKFLFCNLQGHACAKLPPCIHRRHLGQELLEKIGNLQGEEVCFNSTPGATQSISKTAGREDVPATTAPPKLRQCVGSSCQVPPSVSM